MSPRSNIVLSLTAAAPLVYMYLLFISWLISNRVLSGGNYIEISVFITQLVRLVLVFAVRRLRTAPISQIFVIFGLEAFSFVAVTVLFAWSGSTYWNTVLITIFFAWPAGLLCVVPPYVIYRLTAGMWTDRRLVSVVPAAVVLFALLAFVTSTVSTRPAPQDLQGLSSILVSTLLQARAIVVTPQISLSGVPLYLSLAIYAATQGTGVSARWNSSLLLVVFVTLIAIALAVVVDNVPFYPPIVFGVPGGLLISAIWWLTRAR